MSLTVTQRPNAGELCCAKNPVIYKMVRKDYVQAPSVTITNGGGGNSTFNLGGGVDHTADFVAGDSIYLETLDGVYIGFGTVVSSSYSVPTTFITTTVPYVLANSSGGFINALTGLANYHVGVDVYASPANTLISTVNYYPNPAGAITIDIKEPLLSVIDAPFNGVLTEGITEDSGARQFFYIKYTEIWTGSGNSPTNDVANIFPAIFAANQIGQTAFLSSGNLLTKFASINIMKGEFFCLSYFFNQSAQPNFIKKSWYGADGILYAVTYTKNPVTTDSLFTFVQKLTGDFSTTLNYIDDLYPYQDIANGGTLAWTYVGPISQITDFATGATTVITKVGAARCFIPSGGTVQIKWQMSVTVVGAGTYSASLVWLDSVGTLISSSVISTVAGANQTAVVTITPGSDVYFVGVQVTVHGGGGGTIVDVTNVHLKALIPNTKTRIDLAAAVDPVAAEITNTITATIVNQCNAITLFWRNSAGGESSWSFGYVQDQVQKLQDPFRNVWLTLYEQNLTLSQFNALNELITLGQVYQTPLIELTTAVDKTEARVGQQVYTVDTSGNKIGVIVVAGENKTRTRNKRHQFQVTIELPEIFG